MSNEQLKQEIRHRLYAARRKAGEPLADLALEFVECPQCAGRGKYCFEGVDDGVRFASLEVCPRCQGHGFVQRPAE
jgi:DnaJ-class molecular chaperone